MEPSILSKHGHRGIDGFIEGRKMACKNLGNVLVLGLGVSGKAAVEYLLPLIGERVETLTVLGGRSSAPSKGWCDALVGGRGIQGFAVAFDSEDASGLLPEGVDRFDVCIASPGISAFSDMYRNAEACSDGVISEVEFAWRESAEDSIWVAITGTNGKTTTTALTEHLLKASGFDAKAVGNIGDACIAQVGADLAGSDAGSRLCYVVETSSYQLASIDHFAPNAAVVLGITPDHLSWHGSHEHYASSKFKLLSNLSRVPGSVAILDAVNDEVRAKVRQLRSQTAVQRGFEYIPIGTREGVNGDMRAACGSDNAAFVNGEDMLEVALEGHEHVLAKAEDLLIPGVHNQLNALAASAAALAVGATAQSVASALVTFKSLEHRIEAAGEHGGVAYYNDSKATNVDATLVALTAFLPRRPIVMLGGDDKGTDLQPLVDSARSNVKAAVCFGEGGPRFYEALSSLVPDGVDVILVKTFKDAFDAASSMASQGDIVLLSPACASFDEFSCFEERGLRFKELVAELGR